MHRANGEVVLAHLLGQPLNLQRRASVRAYVCRRRTHLAACIAENNGLCDRQRVVQVAQRIELPVFLLDGDEELLDALQRELVALDQDTNGVL